MSRTVSIVGAGRVGISLGKRLHELGWRIGAVVTRSKSSASAAIRRIGAGTPFAATVVLRGSELQLRHKASRKRGALAPEDSALAQPLSSDLILFATPDDVMPAVAQSLADGLRNAAGPHVLRGKVVLHTSATLDRSALAPLARLGASTGSLHPMQAFGGKVVPKLKGVIFGIEGDAKARRLAQSIAKSLGGIPVVIETADKPAYHAAAVMAGGSIYPVLEAGLQLLISVGFTRQRASQTLLPLLRQIFDNIERIGPRAAWTGPLSRGDYAVVAKHMDALRRYPPEFAKSYAALAQLAARILSKDPVATSKRLDRALKSC
jgi:predicted short-subunit dehydrogenase-like oxidoreductase (DUF2520 family)